MSFSKRHIFKLITVFLTFFILIFVLTSCSFFQTVGSMIDGTYDYDKLIDNTLDKYMYNSQGSTTSKTASEAAEEFFKADFNENSGGSSGEDYVDIPKTSTGGTKIQLHEDVVKQIEELLEANKIAEGFEYFTIDFRNMALQGIFLLEGEDYIIDDDGTGVSDKEIFEDRIRDYYGRTIVNPSENMGTVTFKDNFYMWDDDLKEPSYAYEILRIYALDNDYFRIECTVTGEFKPYSGTKNCIVVLKRAEQARYGFYLIAQSFSADTIN